MGSRWRESVHSTLYGASPQGSDETDRAVALLVGLDPVRAIALVRLLAPLARVRLVDDPHRVVEMALELQPDLIVSGSAVAGEVTALLASLGADPALEDIPVIVLATHDGDETRREAMHGGALAWLPHTADSDALLARVRLAVRFHRLAQARGIPTLQPIRP